MLGIKHETFVRFLSILKTLYLVDEVPAWHQGNHDGLNKRSKYFVSDDGKILGIEVKAGSDVGESDFRALKWFRDNLAKSRPFTGVVVHTGELTLPFGPSLYAIPIGEICA